MSSNNIVRSRQTNNSRKRRVEMVGMGRRESLLMICGILQATYPTSLCFLGSQQQQYHHHHRHPQSFNSFQSQRIVNLPDRLFGEDDSSSISKRTLSSSSRLLASTVTSATKQPETVSLKWTDFSSSSSSSDDETKKQQQSPPVLLLHGLLGSKRNFASIATLLSSRLENPRRIIGLDLRNHGESEWSSSMTYREMAHDVLQFLDDNLDVPEVVLVGHSMGGKVAQALSLLAPDRVAGLVVLDIAPVEYCSKEDPHWKAVEDILHAMHGATSSSSSSDDTNSPTTKQDVDKQLRSAVPDPALRAFCLTNFGRDGWKIPLGEIVNELDTLAGFDIVDGSYEGDVFFIHGGQSRFVRHAYLDQIAAFFPNHMLTTIRGAGHWVHAEAPDDTVALLKRFLDR